MPRPPSIPGLLLRLARLRPGWALALALGLGGALGAVALLASPTPAGSCVLVGTDWRNGEWRYDWLEAFALHERGTGSYVLGYGQAVREDMTFAYHVEGDELVLRDFHDRDHEGDWVPRDDELRVRYRVREGDFRFASENPYDDVDEYRYRCELELEGFTEWGRLRVYGDRVSP